MNRASLSGIAVMQELIFVAAEGTLFPNGGIVARVTPNLQESQPNRTADEMRIKSVAH
ncbi:MAG: hypothetical protein WBD01_07870 [Salaquimonas sp.]